ncbi:MAG: HTH domain-containing protein [Bacteroidales bacterium]|nr:HTH domain-containing protein [Bacteroidales bacterium]
MSLRKYVILYDRLLSLIEKKSTGTPTELALKLGVSKRQASNYIHDLRDLGFKIEFCPLLQSYVYKDISLHKDQVIIHPDSEIRTILPRLKNTII